MAGEKKFIMLYKQIIWLGKNHRHNDLLPVVPMTFISELLLMTSLPTPIQLFIYT